MTFNCLTIKCPTVVDSFWQFSRIFVWNIFLIFPLLMVLLFIFFICYYSNQLVHGINPWQSFFVQLKDDIFLQLEGIKILRKQGLLLAFLLFSMVLIPIWITRCMLCYFYYLFLFDSKYYYSFFSNFIFFITNICTFIE